MSSILTTIGRNKLANATPLDQLQITHIAVGDGGGSFPPLLPSLTALTNEVWRGSASAPIKGTDQNVIIFEGFIPANIGGFEIREVGIFDIDGDLIAIGTTALVEKPEPSSGSAITLSVRLHVALESAADVDLVFEDAGAIDHGGLTGRSSAGAHPAAAISTGALASISLPASDLQTVLAALRTGATRTVQETQTDSTVGRLLDVGAFGVGAVLSIADANSAVKSGFYSLPVALGALNSPVTGQSGALLVVNGGADTNYITQVWIHSNDTGTRRMFFRSKAGSAAWGSWVEVYTTASAGTAAAANLQASAGDATSGRVLTNGAHGLGGNAIISNNWNNIVTTGFYRNASTVQAELPIAADQLFVEHIESGAGNASQIAYRSASNLPETWRRARTGSTWGVWVKVAQNGDSVVFSAVTGTSFNRSSDERLKKDIQQHEAVASIDLIQLKKWVWANVYDVPEHLRGTTDTGVIAQDVEKVFPSCVHTNDRGIKTVDYGKLAVHLILARGV